MAHGPYSFLDVAVIDEVRERLAGGDALAVLTVDLDHVIWANGAGAAFLGFADIADAMGAPSALSALARRQIAAAPGFPKVGRDRAIQVRLGGGLSGGLTALALSEIVLPDGEPALLLAVPAGTAANARSVVTGFRAEDGFFCAVLDGEGHATAASPGFEGLDLRPEQLSRLVAEVRHESDRLVKRMVATRGRGLPVGIARLIDEPPTHLLIAVDEGGEPSEAQHDAQPSAFIDAPPAEEPPSVHLEPAIEDEPKPTARASEDRDHWYFSDEEAPADDAPPPAEAIPAPALAPIDPSPVRFVWRTDAQARFTSVSPEFLAATGATADLIVGRAFADVAASFDLDPDGEIEALLARRDTWSGRTVRWPLAGRDLRAPVDLAALPVYDRERIFEGFRGFGVVRMADLEPDVSPALQATRAIPEEAQAASPVEEIAQPQDDSPRVVAFGKRDTPAEAEKVIRLDERRPNQPELGALSSSERNAFREIGDRLRREYGMPQSRPEANGKTAAGRDDGPSAQAVGPAPEDEVAGSGDAEELSASVPADAPRQVDIPPSDDESAIASDEEGPLALAEQRQTDEAGEEAAESLDAPEPIVEIEPDYPTEEDGAAASGLDPAILDALPVPLLVHAGEQLHFANRAFLALTGHDSLEALEDDGGLDALFADRIELDDTEDADGGRLCLRRHDGEVIPVDAHLRSIRWREGSALMMTLAARPLPAHPAPAEPTIVAPATDHARTIATLERQSEELRTIIDTATDGVVLIDNDGTIRHISRPAEALFGLDAGQVEGRPFAELFAIESQKSARDYLAGLAQNGVASVLNDGREVIGREGAGRFIPLFMTIGKLPGAGGYCAVLRDITHWKRAEEDLTQARAQAERASSQKTEFLARVSHEIRTPLNAIIGFSELMMDEKFGPIGSDRYRDYLRDINRSGNHVLDLVNDLLDISKIEAGEQEMQYEAVSLNEALAETVAMMQPQANRERVIIRSSLASRVPEVVADLRSVRQIALNLLSNAIRYTQAGGQVIVSTAYETSGDVVMRVRDTGIGMTLAEIDQALKPFKQINALKRGRHDGTGLGLPLTKAMVESNRARFAISSSPGEGTLVEVTFPSTRVLAD